MQRPVLTSAFLIAWLNCSAAAAVTVTGTAKYQDNVLGATSDKPIRYATIQIRSTSNVVLASDWTRGAGDFSVYVSGLNTGQTFNVVIYAESQAAKVTNSSGATHGAQWSNLNATSSTTNVGTLRAVTLAPPFNVLDVCINAFDYVKAHLSGRELTQVKAVWESGQTSGTYYKSNTITLRGTTSYPDHFNDDVILHEYGHHVAANISTVSVFADGSHQFDQAYGNDLAFSEGFADYFTSAVRNSMSYCMGDGSACILYWNLEAPDYYGSPVPSSNLSQYTEAGVAATLWDIKDAKNEPFDIYENGEDAILSVLDRFDSINIFDRDFEDYYNRWGELRSDQSTVAPLFWHHNIINGPPDLPSNRAPSCGAANVSTTPTLSWTSERATSYDVYFGTSSTPPLAQNTTNSYWYAGTLSGGTTYYWRVVAKNAYGNWGTAVCSFITQASAPGTPSNPNPSHTATGVATSASLTWTGGSNATSHDVYFGTASNPPYVTNTTGTSYNPGTLSSNTTYYWRVVAKNSGGTTTSSTWSFTTVLPTPGTPSNPNPSNLATGVATSINLTWTGGSNATSHDVYFGTSSNPPYVTNTTGTSYSPGALASSTTYYWRVVAKNSSGTTTSATWSFTTLTIIPVPGVPSSPQPSSGATAVTTTPLLSWTGGSNAASHDVYFGTSSNPPYVTNTTGTNYSPGTLASNTIYYWRVVAKNTSGTTTSATWSFTTLTIIPVPGVPSSPEPSSGATGVTTTPLLSWIGGSNATSHDVYFGTSSNPPYVTNTTGTNYSPGTLASNTTYYWRVVAKNSSGSTTSATWFFTTQSITPLPGIPSSPSPINAATGVSTAPVLIWTGGSNATSHDVYFGTSSNPPYVTNTTVANYLPGNLSPNTTYYWRVAAKNAAGATNSPTWSFTTGSSGSGPVTLASGLSNPSSITADATSVYWTDHGSGSVKAVSKSGGPVTTLASGLSSPTGVATDSNYVYFGEYYGNGSSRVHRVAKGGGSPTILVNNLTSVSRVAVNSSNVFWTDNQGGTIGRAPIGGGAASLVATGTSSPAGLATDSASVYWSEYTNPGNIRKAPLAGGAAATLAPGSNSFGVATDGTYVFWTENVYSNAGKVRKTPVGGGIETTLASGLDYPYDLQVDATSVFWVENRTNGAVRQISVTGGSPVDLATALSEPVAIAQDATHVYWIERNGGGSGTGTLKKVAKAVLPGIPTTPTPSDGNSSV